MESNKETKLTPEQEQLLEVTAKWLDLSRTSLLDTKSTEELDWYWNQTNEWIKTYFRQLATSLLAVQQAAGAVLKDYSQANNCSHDKWVRVQPLTGGKE